MYHIQYFDRLNNNLDTASPKFPEIQDLVDFINQNPDLNYSVIFYNNHLVGYDTDCVILNGKPRRKFVNYMSRNKEFLDNYVSPWKTKK